MQDIAAIKSGNTIHGSASNSRRPDLWSPQTGWHAVLTGRPATRDVLLARGRQKFPGPHCGAAATTAALAPIIHGDGWLARDGG